MEIEEFDELVLDGILSYLNKGRGFKSLSDIFEHYNFSDDYLVQEKYLDQLLEDGFVQSNEELKTLIILTSSGLICLEKGGYKVLNKERKKEEKKEKNREWKKNVKLNFDLFKSVVFVISIIWSLMLTIDKYFHNFL